MAISKNDIVRITDLSLTNDEIEICKVISNNTANTWQGDRTPEGRLSDTLLGKYAEKAIKYFLSYDSYNGLNPFIAFYDNFRTDDLKLHTTIDFLFSSNIGWLLKSQEYIQAISPNNNCISLSPSDKQIIHQYKTSVGEIKATRIASRHLFKNGGVLNKHATVNLDMLLGDDFLTYPKYIRKSTTIENSTDYIKEVIATTGLTHQQIMDNEKENLSDWYFRVYVVEKEVGLFDAYIVGALEGVQFLNPFNIRRMPQKGKSESAIYISVPLSSNNGLSITQFRSQYIPILNFKNHLATHNTLTS